MNTLQFIRKSLPASTVFVLGVLVGITTAWGAHLFSHQLRHKYGNEERWFGKEYTFINPLLSCGEEKFDHIGNDALVKLENDLEALVTAQKNVGAIKDVGVYFRQLKGGPWVGIGEKETFSPGSLLKVPLVMSVYKYAETEPTFLERALFYEAGDINSEKHFLNASIEPGRAYSVKELAEAALSRSDNNAAVLLAEALGAQELMRSYTELGVEPPEIGTDYSTDVRTYASFFRILYNATYVSHKHSEEILNTLAKTTFKDALASGVPSDVVVAHKFGERTVGAGGPAQLHDCGVVYHTERPYLLCIMTRGDDFSSLANAIKEISSLVYEHVD